MTASEQREVVVLRVPDRGPLNVASGDLTPNVASGDLTLSLP